MTRNFFLTVASIVLVSGLGVDVTSAAQAKGQACHMEQQCHWENFKKVCVWVKVCR
jgi:hypothetical protein